MLGSIFNNGNPLQGLARVLADSTARVSNNQAISARMGFKVIANTYKIVKSKNKTTLKKDVSKI